MSPTSALDTVLGHVHSIGIPASGYAGHGSVALVIADAVAEFNPDHILIALRTPKHANWKERRLIEHIEDRFHLPVTTYAVDLRGHTPAAEGQCFWVTTARATPGMPSSARGACSPVGVRWS